MEATDRFTVHYLISAGSEAEAEHRAHDLCIEQTAEMPYETIPEHLRDTITGQLISQTKIADSLYETVVSFPLMAAGNEITQFLNVIFGNISLKPGILISDIGWHSLTGIFHGPKTGIGGIRSKLSAPSRPLSCSALKPAGLNSSEIADICYKMALGGIDIIKDDHGLANQISAPFHERTQACLDAIKWAEDQTGKRSLYFPNITGDNFETWRRYEIAFELDAGGVLVSPQLSGLSLLRYLTENGSVLPVMAHPALSGSYVVNPIHGFTPGFYYGSLWRALGADAVIYPNAGGRFSFTEEICIHINEELHRDTSPFKPAFPVPAGGIQLENLGDLIQKYGTDTIFLIGGSLYRHSDGIVGACKEFQEKIESNEQK